MTQPTDGGLRRRTLFGLAGAGVLGAVLPSVLARPALADEPRFTAYPFGVGIASGDPAPDGIVLWTRIAPDPVAEDGFGGVTTRPQIIPVQWQLAEDPSFAARTVVRNGTALAQPDLGYSVHVEVDGLRPDRVYWYRFRVSGELSPVGRTRTAPAPATTLSSLAFAFVSCNNFPDGYFTALGHLAKEDLDLAFHLGDFIYDGGGTGSIGRPQIPNAPVMTLTNYRRRYGQYRREAEMQAACAAVPFVMVLDDHEVTDNWAGSHNKPVGDPADDPVAFLQRRAAAFQAYYENQPLRRSSMPHGPDMQLFRRIGYGGLVDFHVLDTRQYRSQEAASGASNTVARLDPNRTLLGTEQEQWLVDGMSGSAAAWNVVAQQSKVAETDDTEGPGESYPNDNWDGYAYSRTQLFDAVHDRGIDNMVILSGDAHVNIASDLKPQFKDPDSPVVGAEFLGTSISSGGNGAEINASGQARLRENPHIKFYNNRRGYQRVLLTPQEFRVEFQVLPFVNQPGAPAITRAVGYVEVDRPGIAQMEDKTIV